MQARHPPREAAGVALIEPSERPSSHEQPRPRPKVARLERHPADGAMESPAETTCRGRLGSGREVAATFRSILFPAAPRGGKQRPSDQPEFFRDLNLDKVVAAIIAGKDDYDLAPLFYRPTRDLATIDYRHAVMRDLERDDVLQMVRSFAKGMRSTRQHLDLSAKLRYAHQKKLWFLDAVATYCAAVVALAATARAATLRSRGLMGFRDYLIGYTNSNGFTTLVAETEKLKADLSTVKYSMLIKGDKITVEKYEDTPDYSAVVERTFDRFQQGAVKNYLVKFTDSVDMNHVEAAVLGFVADLYPEIFSRLDGYVERNQGFIDPMIGRFDREIQFYVAFLDHIAVLKDHGLRFCYPSCRRDKAVESRDGFDLALAHQLVAEKAKVVCNDFHLEGSERILVVSGPNQGGKTTFARAFGQLHYLASLGCRCRGPRPSSSCSTGCSPISSAPRTSRPCAASSRTTWSASTRFWRRQPRTASSS